MFPMSDTIRHGIQGDRSAAPTAIASVSPTQPVAQPEPVVAPPPATVAAPPPPTITGPGKGRSK